MATPRELSTVRMFGAILLGSGMLMAIPAVPTLVAALRHESIPDKGLQRGPQPQRRGVPGLALVGLGSVFMLLGGAALLAARREMRTNAIIETERMVGADSQGLWIQHAGSRHLVRWSSILRITAFKRDLLTVDRISLEIEAPPDTWEIHEEMAGYKDALQLMEQALGGFPSGWWDKVVQPAFATNPTLIYERKEA